MKDVTYRNNVICGTTVHKDLLWNTTCLRFMKKEHLTHSNDKAKLAYMDMSSVAT